MTIDELLISLGFELDESSLKDLDKLKNGFKDATKQVAKLAAAAVAGTAALSAFVKVISNDLDELEKSSQILGITADELDRLKFGMDLVAGSSDSMSSELLALAKNASEASRGIGSAVETFGMLNVQVMDSEGGLKGVQELLFEILESTEGLDNFQRIEFLEKLGLGSFALSSEQIGTFMEAMKEAGDLSIITREDTKKAEAFNDEIARGLRVLKDLSIVVASAVSPILKEIIQDFRDWIMVNKEFIRGELKETFTTIGKMIGLGASAALKFIGLIMKLTRMVGGLNNVLKVTAFVLGLITAFSIGKMLLSAIALVKGLTASVFLLNAKLILIPAIIGVLLGLLVLVADEMATFAEGGDTLFSKLMQKFPVFEETIVSVLAGIMTAWDEFMEVLSDPLNEDNWVRFFDSILKLFGGTIEGFKTGTIKAIAEMIEPIREALASLGLIDAPAINSGTPGAGSITRHLKGPPKRGVTREDLGNGGGSTSTTKFDSTQKVEVTIKGNTSGMDTKAVEKAIIEASNQMNQSALRDIETGLSK